MWLRGKSVFCQNPDFEQFDRTVFCQNPDFKSFDRTVFCQSLDFESFDRTVFCQTLRMSRFDRKKYGDRVIEGSALSAISSIYDQLAENEAREKADFLPNEQIENK